MQLTRSLFAAALLLACTNAANTRRSHNTNGGAGGTAEHGGTANSAGDSAFGGAEAGMPSDGGSPGAEAGDSSGGEAGAEVAKAGASSGIAGQGGQPGAGGAAQGGDTSNVTAGTGTGGALPGSHWVGTWTGAPQQTETGNLPPTALSNTTLRQVVHVSLGGSQVRVRFSNEFGNNLLTINQAHVARCTANPVDSSIDVATDQPLAFEGTPSVTINPGKAVWSDPLDFTLAALSNLSVTTAFGTVPSNVTGHPGSRGTSHT